jgi:hypothetical protein
MRWHNKSLTPAIRVARTTISNRMVPIPMLKMASQTISLLKGWPHNIGKIHFLPPKSIHHFFDLTFNVQKMIIDPLMYLIVRGKKTLRQFFSQIAHGEKYKKNPKKQKKKKIVVIEPPPMT